MFGKIAFLISVGGLSTFVIIALSNMIMEGIYGLSESRYKLMLSFAVSAIFFGIYIVLRSPGA